MAQSYEKAGVNLEAGYEVVRRIKKHVASTSRPGVMGNIGAFGGMFDLSALNVKEPVLVSGTDGVGTKLKLAFEMDKHDTIGIDAVAMCVNDVLAQGAEPLEFLDYVAVGRNEPQKVEAIVAGVADGCRQAGCALVGGETAEMPGMYAEGEYDIAGFTVGVVEKSQLIDGSKVKAGDVLAALDGDSLQYRAAELSSDLAALDQQLGSRKTRSRITAPVEGRVKYQPAAAGDDVIEAVNEYGCLAILSTDGSMEVRLQTDAALSLNDKVTVQWDGGSAEGTLVSRLDGGWLVTFSDEKAPYQETAEVYSDSMLLGSEVMEIHAPLAIFGNGGTISEVSYSVNTRVYAGTTLFTLENEPDTDSYRKALSDRNEKAGQLQDMLMLQTSRNVVAPADGTVQLIGVEEGKKTASADGSGDVTAFTLGSGGAVKMTVEVDELDVAKVQVGQSAEVTLDAFSGEKFAAEVSRISRIGKPSGSITVYETDLMLTGDDRLLEGMNGTAVILSERKENVLLIPLGAVHEDENGSYVNRVTADGSTERAAIETGLSDGSNAEVLSGLYEGDEIAYTPASTRRMFGFGPMSGAGFGGEQP